MKMFRVQVQLNANITMPYNKGLETLAAWEEFCKTWRKIFNATGATGLDSLFVTDKRGFHYFALQKRIVHECFSGIALSLLLACLVLLLATRNVVVALSAIVCIASIVASVMAFAVVQGWKLGVLEA